LLRLFFGHNVPPSINIAHIQEYKDKMVEMLQVFETIEASLRSCHPADPNLKYWLMTIHYGRLQAKAMIQWSEDSIGQLKS
jgi:PadR family transcriptional regulator AphA